MKILKFGAVWCPACLVMKPVWKEINNLYPDLDITEYDYDMDEDYVVRYNVGYKLPVIIKIDNNGCEIDRLIGEKKKEEIIRFIGE